MESRIAGRAYLASIVSEARHGSLRLVCPFCDGGPDKEISLVLTIRDDGAFYCCHRASCGQKGAIGANTRRLLGGSESKIVGKQHEPYRGGMQVICAADPAGKRFRHRPWGPGVRMPVDIDLFTDEGRNREIWVLRNILGERVGVQVRWTEGGKKRVKTYKETTDDVYTSYGCLKTPEADSTWIVEDPMSAALIHSHGIPSIALCGTYLSKGLAVELLAQEAYTNAFVVALDPGAEDAAMRVKNTLQGVVTVPVHIMYNACDIKDMRKVHLHKTLSTRYT